MRLSLFWLQLYFQKLNASYFIIKIVAIMTELAKEEPPNTARSVNVHVEYCGACDYGGHCLALAQTIRQSTPNATVSCKRGRQGSFEVVINDKLVYSKLQTMALPDYNEVSQVVSDVSQGNAPKEIKRQQPIDCAIS